MTSSTLSPYRNVVASIATYSTILVVLGRQERSYSSTRTHIKGISACHSIIATCLTTVALSQKWIFAPHIYRSNSDAENDKNAETQTLNDSQNPLISSQNSLANFVAAWEAGYLIYDTVALLFESYLKNKSGGVSSAMMRLVKESPIFVVHHVLLASALLWLQTYIAVAREKGLKVIMAFFLMNASNPLLHLRWYMKKITGRSDTKIDIAFAAGFAISRFGSVYWVIRKYGEYHGLGTWQSLRRQRTVCQTGTGLLTGLNVLWWGLLVAQMVKRKQRTKTR